jgi:RNA polymerase sigma-70 factor (ECF subfamily)
MKPRAGRDPLLSDEPTIELVIRAHAGDRLALEALLQRCLPALKRWAHGRLPPAARSALETEDLVQEAAFHAIRRLDLFKPRHVGAMQAYLRQSVVNLVRDEVRRVTRHPAPEALSHEPPSDERTPEEGAILHDSYDRYRDGLARLRPRERELIVAHLELEWSTADIAQYFGMTVDAARMAVGRAVRKLSRSMAPTDARASRAPAKGRTS